MKSRSGWLSPLVFLSSNWISMIGVGLVTTAGISWIFLLPASFHEMSNPYLGILTAMILPAIFFTGLALIPLGIWLRFKKEKSRGTYPEEFPPLAWTSPELRKLVIFVGTMTVLNLIIGSQTTYSAVAYMDSTAFCGLTCHTVMKPEYTAYQASPHSRVECTKCHIGPGASWFVKAKITGIWQVFAVTFNTYEKPIPTPVRNLRPARDTCESCHWPQRYGEDKLRVTTVYGEDEANTAKKNALLMRIGVIHAAHLRDGVKITYAHSDEKRQKIPWVKYNDAVYRDPDYKSDGPGNLPTRLMDCMDCHNRPAHSFELADRSVNLAMWQRTISSSLPFAKKTSLDVLKTAKDSAAVASEFESYYQKNYPAAYSQRREEIRSSAKAVQAVFDRNVFPEMNITWGTYPNNLGHNDFPGCFRCHDDSKTDKAGKKMSQDCNLCHSLLAMDEAAPKILTDMGVASELVSNTADPAVGEKPKPVK
jgi:nitrate/TMAO reductase-like tetraheme cytochrome c subunit